MTGSFKDSQSRKFAALMVLILLFLSFFAYTLFGDSGILVNMRVNEEAQTLETKRNRLKHENRELKREIVNFKTNARKIESISREEFGFGRPGEVIFYFPEHEEDDVQVIRHPDEDGEPRDADDTGEFQP